MTSRKQIRRFKQWSTIGYDKKRFASRLEGGSNAPECLGVVWDPVKNAEADDLVESLPPVRVVSYSQCVSYAVCHIGCRVRRPGDIKHLL